jgi:hypothetical protein
LKNLCKLWVQVALRVAEALDRLADELDDYEDLKELRAAKAKEGGADGLLRGRGWAGIVHASAGRSGPHAAEAGRARGKGLDGDADSFMSDIYEGANAAGEQGAKRRKRRKRRLSTRSKYPAIRPEQQAYGRRRRSAKRALFWFLIVAAVAVAGLVMVLVRRQPSSEPVIRSVDQDLLKHR